MTKETAVEKGLYRVTATGHHGAGPQSNWWRTGGNVPAAPGRRRDSGVWLSNLFIARPLPPPHPTPPSPPTLIAPYPTRPCIRREPAELKDSNRAMGSGSMVTEEKKRYTWFWREQKHNLHVPATEWIFIIYDYVSPSVINVSWKYFAEITMLLTCFMNVNILVVFLFF